MSEPEPQEIVKSVSPADTIPSYGDQLKKAGFRSIGESEILQYEGFMIKIQDLGLPIFYTDYEHGNGTIEAIRPGSVHKEEDGLEYLTTERYGDAEVRLVHKKTLNGSGSSGKYDHDEGSDFPNIPIEAQLTQAGFKEDEKVHGLYRKNLEGQEILAIVENKTLKKLLKPLQLFRFLEKITKIGFNINGTGKRIIRGIEYPVLICANDAMEFEIDKDGRVWITNLLREFTDEELGLSQVESYEEEGGFKVGGINTTGVIRGLEKINGRPIEKLEEEMHPGKSSHAGFLGQNEALKDVLAADNDFVIEKGLTHQEIAHALNYVCATAVNFQVHEVPYKGRKYKVDYLASHGSQESPFGDGINTNKDFIVTNLDTGKRITYSGLLPDMIERYGFYEGRGTSYRLDPQEVIDVFDLLLNKKPHLIRNFYKRFEHRLSRGAKI